MKRPSAEGREPYGLDHWLFRNPAHPKNEGWRWAALLEHEIGLRAALWSDMPFDLHNAVAVHRAQELAEPEGQLDLFGNAA